MRVGLISDIHANLPALQAILADAQQQGVSGIWNLGDCIGYNPFPEEVLQILRTTPDIQSIVGNYDLNVLAFAKHRSQWQKIKELLGDLIDSQGLTPRQIRGIGIGIPGIVDTKTNRIFLTPNINLSRFPLAAKLRKSFPTRIALGNDVNLGLLGEKWLGAGTKAKNIVGIFPGTGIGGALILSGELYTGFQGIAGEIGHMIIDLNGPLCSCGNHGCLEALASRWAIERDIRQAIKQGRKSVIRQLASGKLSAIKSKVIKKALKLRDPLVTQIMRSAAKALGKACVSVRHLMNPELIILGGGIIEACEETILPIVTKIVDSDPFLAHLGKCPVRASQLKDDAVMLGAVALVKLPAKSRHGQRVSSR